MVICGLLVGVLTTEIVNPHLIEVDTYFRRDTFLEFRILVFCDVFAGLVLRMMLDTLGFLRLLLHCAIPLRLFPALVRIFQTHPCIVDGIGVRSMSRSWWVFRAVHIRRPFRPLSWILKRLIRIILFVSCHNEVFKDLHSKLKVLGAAIIGQKSAQVNKKILAVHVLAHFWVVNWWLDDASLDFQEGLQVQLKAENCALKQKLVEKRKVFEMGGSPDQVVHDLWGDNIAASLSLNSHERLVVRLEDILMLIKNSLSKSSQYNP